MRVKGSSVRMNKEQLSVATIRSLCVDSVENAKNGHMGMPLGSAPMAYVLFKELMNYNPKNPSWDNRDRFVLTSGHGSILLYAMLHLSGYELPLDELKAFRKLHSMTPGHPEVYETPGVEATTGPLGQGISMTVGLAIAEAHLAARYNREGFPIVDHFTYTICGDGDLQEGVAQEAATIAGNLGLGKLIVLYDSNDITSDGPLTLSNTENTKQKFEAMNWQVLKVADGNNLAEIRAAIKEAQLESTKPTLIEVKNIIGFGSPSLQGTEKIHSNPVGEVEAIAIKKKIGWQYTEPFYIPTEVKENFSDRLSLGVTKEQEWEQLFTAYKAKYPELAKEYQQAVSNEFTVSAASLVPFEEEQMATRTASGKMLNRLYQDFPNLVGGSADLASSNKTTIEGQPFMAHGEWVGPNIHFGVREFAMASIENGLALHGGLKAYCGTFLIFSDYMRSAIRHAALMGIPVTFIMTHDSLHVGQDGPTHQPVEHLISLRAMPNITVIRPADANETIGAWKLAIEAKKHPHVITLGRHDIPVYPQATIENVAKGAYVISKAKQAAEGLIIATGSEVCMAIEAQEKLAVTGKFVDVISMPSWELFEEQPNDYKEAILPPSMTKRLSVELGSTVGWEKYVGPEGASLGIDQFGASGPAMDLLADRGFTVERIVDLMEELLS